MTFTRLIALGLVAALSPFPAVSVSAAKTPASSAKVSKSQPLVDIVCCEDVPAKTHRKIRRKPGKRIGPPRKYAKRRPRPAGPRVIKSDCCLDPIYTSKDWRVKKPVLKKAKK